jgi:hypothetical protein
METYRKAWTEKEEIEFIQGIGTFSKLKIPRVELLRGYRQAIAKRTDWTGIDRKRVFFHADAAFSQASLG